MNGRETAAAEKALDNQRRAHLVDAEAVRRALLGDPVALTELERGATVSICDTDGFDRELCAQGLGITSGHLDKLISRRRRAVGYAYRNALAAGMRAPALALVDAVNREDVEAVAEILTGRDQQAVHALAIVLADMAGTAGVARDPGADEAPADPIPAEPPGALT